MYLRYSTDAARFPSLPSDFVLRLEETGESEDKQSEGLRKGYICAESVPICVFQNTKKERELLPPPAKELRHDKVRTAHSMCLSCPPDRHSVTPDSFCNPGERTFLFQKLQKLLLFCKLRNILPRPHRTTTSKRS